MTCCSYCERQAVTTILSNPERVCREHAEEFWTGLLGFAMDRRRDAAYESFPVSFPRALENVPRRPIRVIREAFPLRVAS